MSALSTPAGGGIITGASSSVAPNPSSATSTTAIATATAQSTTKPTVSGKSKYQKLDINNLYFHGKSENSEPASGKSLLSRKHGMQSLGKVPCARRPPANLPSLKTESGLDSNSTSGPVSSAPTGQSAPSSQQQAQGTTSVPPPNAAAGPVTQGVPGSAQPPIQVPQHHQSQICAQQNVASHPHAGGYQGGWAGLPPHRTAQFQQEFPSLDGSTPTPPPLAPAQSGQQQSIGQGGPALRPHTEGGWLGAGGGRGEGPAPVVDPRTSMARAVPLPSFMVKGNPGMGGGGYQGMPVPPPARGGPNRGPPHHGPPPHHQHSHHHHQGQGPPPPQVHHRAREVPTIEKLMQRPIIKEEELYSMDKIAKDAGWATNDDIDYNQKLAFSDDESPSKDPPPSSKSGSKNSQQDKDKDKESSSSSNNNSSSSVGGAMGGSTNNSNNASGASSGGANLSGAKDRQGREPAVLTKNMEDDEMWAVRQRQRNQEVSAAVERARQRQEQDERRYQQQLQNKDEKNAGDSQQGSQVAPATSDWTKDPPEKSPSSGRDSDTSRPPPHGLPSLDRSASRDSVRNGPTDQVSSDRQIGGDSRNFRDNKERDRGRDRDYPRDNRDFYHRDRNRDMDWERDSAPRSDRDNRQERENSGGGYGKYFNPNLPPRFAKQQARGGGQQQERMGFERVEFARSNSGNFNDSNKHRDGDSRGEQQYDNARWPFPNMKNIPGGVQREPFGKRGQDDKGMRRDRDMKDGGEKVDDRRRERHTPDEPRGQRHPTRKLSGSSDGRHQSTTDYDEREEDYRWEKDHDRRSGSNQEDKKHSEYNDREGSYDWRSSDKEYPSDNKSRNYNRDIDRQSSRESQKEFDRKSDFDRKSAESYEPKNSAEKLTEVFDRKCAGQDFSDRKSDSYDRKSAEKFDRRDERQDSNKQPDRPDSRDSRISRDSFKPDSFSDKEYQSSWAEYIPETFEKEAGSYGKGVSNNNAKPGFQEKPHFEKVDSNKNESYTGNYREKKDYKSDSDESKRSCYGQLQHMKKTPSNLKKSDLPSTKEKSKLEETQPATTKEDANANNAAPKFEAAPKAWADSLSPGAIISESNMKNQNAEINKADNKDIDASAKFHDTGKERAERKLSSSGSEKKTNVGGGRNRLDSGGSRKGYVFYNRERGSWGRGGGDPRRRPGRGRSNRDPMYSESEVSGDEDKGRMGGMGGHGKGGRGGGQFSNERKRHDSRGEAFAPRGEPSRRGRGSFRGRSGGYQPNKNTFGQAGGQTGDLPENDVNKTNVDNLSSDEKIKLKQQALSAGISGKDRRGGGVSRGGIHDKGKKKVGGPASTEEEAWETTSEHSEGGSKGAKHKGGRPSHLDKEKKHVGPPQQQQQHQNKGPNAPTNRQNSSGSITKGNQPIKKDTPPLNATVVGRVDDIKYNDTAAITSALGDIKISANKQSKDQKSDKSADDGTEIIDDGFQEVKSKGKEKMPRIGGAPPFKDDPQNVNRQQGQKGQLPNNNKQLDTQRNAPSNRSSNEKLASASGAVTRPTNTGPPNATAKINGPQGGSGYERHNIGPPQNKPSQFDRPRQSNLPPRLVKQREHNRMQKQIIQGLNQQPGSEIGTPVPAVPSSAWDKPINQTLSEQPAVSTISGSECNDMGVSENHSEQSSQRSTPNNQAVIEQKAPGNREKPSTFDGTSTPVQTIIFENTNYKSAPNDALKQKFAPSVSQTPSSQPNSGQQQKPQQQSCLPSKPLVPMTSQTSELENQMLNFTTEAQQQNAFMSELMNQDPNQTTVKADTTPLQLPMSFVSKSTTEDSSDIKLDFFDSDLSQLTDDKSGKGLGMRSITISSPSQNTMSTATDQELNMKIASVKKVWDTSSVIENPVADESSHAQHNLAVQHMAVSSPHSLSAQHNISSHHITSQHNLASQHNLTSQHNLAQQLNSPHNMSQHNLVSQHGLSSQHNMNVSSASVQFSSGFEDHQTNSDVGQSQGFSPGANGNISSQTTNVCKVKPTQQALHSSQGITQSPLQNMPASLISQNTALQGLSMGSVSQGIQGVGGVMGLSPPPMPQAYNHINYPPNQYGGISAIPSPPTVVYNSSHLNSSQHLPSQGGLYNAFQIDQSRSQFGAFPGGPYGAGSTPYNYQPQDMFQGLQSQYRMQDLFQAAGTAAAFGQSGQLGTNPSTVLISSSTNSLMSASVKPPSQQIGAIGTKGSTYGGQQYLGYGGPHEGGGSAPPPPPYTAPVPPPSLVRAAPPPQAAPPPPQQLQPPNTYYSQTTGGQTGFYQQPGNVSANYGLQFGQPNQSHSNASLQGFGSQVLSNQFQIAAAIQQQYGRTQQQPSAAAAAYGVSASQQQNQQSSQASAANAAAQQAKQQQDHQPRPQQLKSPLQDHQNNGMFCNLSQQPPQAPQSAPPAPYTSVPPPQHVQQQHAAQQAGTHSPKGGTPNSAMGNPNKSGSAGNINNASVGIVAGNAAGNNNGMGNGSSAVIYQQQNAVKQQHSPPHHKYQNYHQHIQQVMQGNGRQGSLNMPISRGGGLQQQRYPPPIQRPPPVPIHQQTPTYGYQQYRATSNMPGNNNRHTGGNSGPPHQRQGGYYQQTNNRNNNPTVTPSPSDQPKAVTPSGEENCPSPAVTSTTEQLSVTATSVAQPLTSAPTTVEVTIVDKKPE